jgi:hypothetical protein
VAQTNRPRLAEVHVRKLCYIPRNESLLALGGVAGGVWRLTCFSLARWKTADEAAVALHGGYFCSFVCGSLWISSAVMLT